MMKISALSTNKCLYEVGKILSVQICSPNGANPGSADLNAYSRDKHPPGSLVSVRYFFPLFTDLEYKLSILWLYMYSANIKEPGIRCTTYWATGRCTAPRAPIGRWPRLPWLGTWVYIAIAFWKSAIQKKNKTNRSTQ